MANIKISELNATTSLNNNDLIPVVDITNSETKKITKENFMSTTSEIDNTYGTSTSKGYSQNYINSKVNYEILLDSDTIKYETFTLNKNPLEYKKIIIFVKDGNYCTNQTMYPEEETKFEINMIELGASWSAVYALYGELTSTGVTITSSRQAKLNTNSSSTTTIFGIYKIIGYK